MGYFKDDSFWVGVVLEFLGGGGGFWILVGYMGYGMLVVVRIGIFVV